MIYYNLPTGQMRVLHFIERTIAENGQSPTLEEIATEFDYTKQYAKKVVDALEKKGRISRDKHQQRSITLIKEKTL